jgi:hypothetical protein
MYIEDKSELVGPCRIGRVTFSKTGATLRYDGRAFQSLKGHGFKANYFDVETGQRFWISGPRKDGADGLYGRITQPEDVDADIADDYWRNIRGVKTPVTTATGESFNIAPAATDTSPQGRKAVRLAKLSVAAG